MDFVWEIENRSRQVWLVVLREWISSVSVVNFKLSRDVRVFVILRVSILKIRSKSEESQVCESSAIHKFSFRSSTKFPAESRRV